MALAIVVSNLVVAVVVVQSVVGAVAAVGFVAVGSVGFDFAAAVVVVGVECFGAAMRSYLWLLRLARPQSLAKSRPQLPVDSIGLFGELLGWPLRRRVIEHRLGFERSSRLVLDRISLRLKVLEIYAHQSISERASDLKLLSSRHLPGACLSLTVGRVLGCGSELVACDDCSESASVRNVLDTSVAAVFASQRIETYVFAVRWWLV